MQRQVCSFVALGLLTSSGWIAEGLLRPAQADFFWGNSDTYGRDGRSGPEGRSGRSGRDGQNQTIVIQGTPATLDLSGQNGEDGDDGRDGDRAECRFPREDVSHNLTGANGGNGGNGGSGGNGGNAGSLTIYYRQLTDLRNILIHASGGEGGRGGRGGYGGAGCRCPRHDWTIETCKGTPGSADYKCRKSSYTCTDGRDGENGTDGRDGDRGRMGQLTILNRPTPLPPEEPSRELSLADWQQQPVNLSQNRWITRSGASTLLAPGSAIADTYTMLEERVERSAQLRWQAQSSLSNFGTLPIRFRLDDSKQVDITFPEEFWGDTTIAQQGSQTTVTVERVMRRQEALRLGVVGLRGSGSKLTLKLLDTALQSHRVLTQNFRLKYQVRTSDRSTPPAYDGEIPASLITVGPNEFTLALGKLPIDPTALQAGTQLDLEITATRAFAQNRADQVIRWQGVIGALPKSDKDQK